MPRRTIQKTLGQEFTYMAMQRSLWDLSSPTGIKPATSAVRVQSLNNWTAREFPIFAFTVYFFIPWQRFLA